MALFDVPDPLDRRPGKLPGDLDAFDPRFRWNWPKRTGASLGGTSASGRQALPGWGVALARPFAPPLSYAPLETALHAANFQPTELLSGSLPAFSGGAGTYGVPLSAAPTAVLYNVQAFAAARLPPPPAEWTVDDFEKTCAALVGAMRGGRVPQCYAVLPALVGWSSWTVQAGKTSYRMDWAGQLVDANVWGAFVLGYGGSVVRYGRFDLSDPGAMRGLARLVAIARAYGAGPQYTPHQQADVARLLAGAAMRFGTYNGGPAPAGFRYARFPRLPVRPVVPATLLGVEPAQMGPGGEGWRPAYSAKGIPIQALEATVAYARWVYHALRSDPHTPGTLPPVLSDGAVQRAYFGAAARVADGAGSIGAWRHYVFVQQGWPRTPRAKPSAYPFTNAAQWQVFAALTDVVRGGAPLAGSLARAARILNGLPRTAGG